MAPAPSPPSPLPAMVPPRNLKWSFAMQQLALNSSKLVILSQDDTNCDKQMEEMHQTARQAVTVTLRAVPQLRKLTRDAGGARDRLGIHARLGMRRVALAALMTCTRQLLEDLDIFFGMVDGTMARTYARRVQNLLKDLGGAQEGFSLAESEMDQACRFMLVREPRVVVDPIDAGARVAQEGQRDTKQVDGVAHSVLVAQGMLAAVWSTLLALQAAEITVEEPAWQLMAQLDIYGATSVLRCLQLQIGGKSVARGDSSSSKSQSPNPKRVPNGARDKSTPWWKSKSLRPSKKSSSTEASLLQTPPQVRPQHSQPDGCFSGFESAGHLSESTAIQVRKLKSGDMYCGPVLGGRKVGAGMFQFACSDVYVGEFLDDVIQGLGVYNFRASSAQGTYSGQWLNGKYEGFGVEFFKNDSYHGEYRGGARQGWGTATFENGDAYEGQWAAGVRHGIGMHLSADGSTYIGGFLNGKRHGHGSFTSASGGQYQGQYELDVPHGHGTYQLHSGHSYEGRWEGGQKEGWFRFNLPTGQHWAGRWAKGRPQWVEAVLQDKAETAVLPEAADGQPTGRLEALELAMAEGAKASVAAATAVSMAKDQWSPSSAAQTALQSALVRADAAAQSADSLQAETRVALAAAAEAAASVEAAEKAAASTTV